MPLLQAPNTIETMKAMHINPSPSTMEMKKIDINQTSNS
jgi:hypothetical protein